MESTYTEFIESIETMNTGGWVMVDYIKLRNGIVMGISDECVVFYKSMDQARENEDYLKAVYFEDLEN